MALNGCLTTATGDTSDYRHVTTVRVDLEVVQARLLLGGD